jgi:uracil-DNA glycosylase
MVVSAEKRMQELDEKIKSCQLCTLSNSRKNAVPGSGNEKNPDVVFVGEAPGRKEDLQGQPFVGAAGKLLDELLKAAGVERDQVYITNVVKCRPPNNRKPERAEVETCTTNYLEEQLKLLSPKLVCTLGATALEYFTGEKKMGDNRGRVVHANTASGVAVLPTYHPASVFRNRSLKSVLGADIKKIPGVLTALQSDEKESNIANVAQTRQKKTRPRNGGRNVSKG